MENLKSLADRTTEEQREIAIKGGKASGEARRKKKRFKELFEIALNQENEEGVKNDVAIVRAMIKKATKGSVMAFESIRDTTGEIVGALDIDTEDITSEQIDKMNLQELSDLFIKRVLKNVILNPTKESIEETLKILSLAKNNKKE
jgi:flagellar motor component MotA